VWDQHEQACVVVYRADFTTARVPGRQRDDVLAGKRLQDTGSLPRIAKKLQRYLEDSGWSLALSTESSPAQRSAGAYHVLLSNADLVLFFGAVWLKVGYFHLTADVGLFPSGGVLTSLFLFGLATLTLYLPRGGRLPMLLALNLVLTGILTADLLYCRFFEDVIAVPVLRQVWQTSHILGSIRDLFSWQDLVLIADFPLWGVLIWLRGRVVFRQRPAWRWLVYSAAAGCFAWAFCGKVRTVQAQHAEVFQHVYSCKFLASRLGILPYHVYDLAVTLAERFAAVAISPAEFEAMQRWFKERNAAEMQAPVDPRVPFGLARGKNIFVIQVESLQPDVIGMMVDGQPVTPHLDALIRESLYFERCFDQTHNGRSSDADFCGYNSLHPVARGSVVCRFPEVELDAFPAMLRRRGYHTFIACGMEGSFWNMNWMHARYGFAQQAYERDLQGGEVYGLGITDISLFQLVLERIDKMPQPFLAHCITLTNHHPYCFVPEGFTGLKLGSLAGTQAGDLLQSVHYTDVAIGQFLDGLKARGLYDDSVILIYGDHDGQLPRDQCRLLDGPASKPWGFKGLDRVAMILRLPGGIVAERRKTTTGHLDFAPTLMHLAGISRDGTFMLGNNLFRGNGNAVIPFRDGSFADQKHLFMSPDGTWENGRVFLLDTAEEVDRSACERSFHEARLRLRMSDWIIQGDLLPRLKRAGE